MIQRLINRFPFPAAFPWKIFFGGLLLRLLIMPFAVHSDFIHMVWASSCSLFDGKTIIQMQTILVYLHSATEWLALPLVTSAPSFCSSYNFNLAQVNDEWLRFISQPEIFRLLFIYKFPYLVMDVACVVLLYKTTPAEWKLRIFKFWWWNPLILFAVYIFGRHETITLFFIILSIYFIKTKRSHLGLLSLGIAIALRYYALFLLPVYLLTLDTGWKKRFQNAATCILPWFLVNLFSWGINGTPEILMLAAYPNENYLLPVKFTVAGWDNLFIFPLGYFLILLYLHSQQKKDIHTLLSYSLLVLLWMYATTYIGQSPHYWTWFLPFLAFLLPDVPNLLWFFVLQTICLWGYSLLGNRAFAGYLFGPLAPHFFWSIPSPIELIAPILSPETFISLAHTGFSTITLWMMYMVFQKNARINAGIEKWI